MKQGSTAGASQRPSFRICLWWWDGRCSRLVASCVVLCLYLCLPGAATGGLDQCADGYGEFVSSRFGQGSSAGPSDHEDVCGSGSGSFCFPSTLMGFLDEEGAGRREGSSWHPGYAAFRMANGGMVSCSFKDSMGGIHDKLHSENKNDVEGIASCKAPRVPDAWMRTAGGSTGDLDEYTEEIETCILNGSASPPVEINPPVLDWGTRALYSPSLASLSLTNTCNGSILHVYDLFSTNFQFYAYDFDEVSLAPGESASISFMFLPRWLGSLSSHIVMQTNFGGFVIHAKGVAIESPYQIEPFVDGSMNRGFFLYNPFDHVLHVEEVTAWILVSSENMNHFAHIVCGINESRHSSDEFSSLPTVKEWLTVKSGEVGLSWMDIRPYEQWEVPPHNSRAIIGMNLWPHLEGTVSGAICMQLQNSTRDGWADTVIIPIEVEGHARKTYHDLSGSLSAFLDPFMPCDGGGYVFSLSVRNDASNLLSVLKISEVTEAKKLFQVNYMEGLIIYPKSVTRTALISYTHVDSHSNSFKIPSISFSCELSIVTNDSVSPEIKIPCQDLIHACSSYQLGSSFAAPEGSYVGLLSQYEKEKSANARTGSLGSIIEESLPIKRKLSEVVKADELILRNWRSQGTMSEMSVLKDNELLFPAVQIGNYSSMWITVHNPSQKPVVMQLVLNSGVIVDHCKSDDVLSKNTFLSRFSHIDSRETQDGFSIADSARTEAFVHPLGSALFGPVIFHPSKRCMWRSSALIRNNLSGLEWLPLRAFGVSHSLVLLEGSVPIWKLEFNLDQPMSVNDSYWDLLPNIQITSSSCNHMLSKEIYAKNTGELPLEVLKLDVSGSNCGLGGFMIHNCEGFALGPGESTKLLISYQADFTAAVVHRDLELAMATGIFVIPMKAILPVYMLKFCRRSFFRKDLWNLSVLVLATASILFLVIFRIIPHASSSGTEYYFVKNDNTISTITIAGKPSRFQRNDKKSNSRSHGEDDKPEVSYANRYPNYPDGVHVSTKRMQSTQELNTHKKTPLSRSSSTTKPLVVLDNSNLSETPHTADLTVRVFRERGRRRKRKITGANLTAKFDVSSSQSGNSTPSSPLSPNTLTLNQVWPLSPDTAENLLSQISEKNHQKRHDTEVAMEARPPETEKCYDNSRLLPAEDQPHVTLKSTGRSTLLPSATFPCTSWRAPGMAVPNFLASTSPIALHARAPGSKLGKDKSISREESDVLIKDFTYDIWGNNFSDHLLGRPKEIASKVFDASEGDSQSFFARDPQSLMMMPSACAVSPGHKLPLNDVNHLHEMD